MAAAKLAAADSAEEAEACAWLVEFDASSLVRQAAIPGVREPEILLRCLGHEPSWVVRCKLLRALPEQVTLDDLRAVSSDPHWRVRAALIERLEQRDVVTDWADTPQESGLSAYLAWCATEETGDWPPLPEEAGQPEWWDPDPAVLLTRLEQLDPRTWRPELPALLRHVDDRVRRRAVQELVDYADAALCRRAVEDIDDPRSPAWVSAADLVRRLDPGRRPSFNFDRAPARSLPVPEGIRGVRTSERKVSQAEARFPEDLAPSLQPGTCRLAISGHYHLPTEAYPVALEAGVRDFFWEPNYAAFRRFVHRLSDVDRSALRIITGSFEATPEAVRRDLEQALRALQLEAVDTFLLFWVRSESRLSDDLSDCMHAFVREGKVSRIGLSTHKRNLAAAQLRKDWNPVMVRHNAAHRGAEETVLPLACALRRPVIAFNATCHGRLLQAGISARDCLRYVLRDAGIGLVLSAPATRDQLRENLSALDAPPMAEAEIARLRSVGDRVYRRDKAFESWVRSR